MNGDSWDYSCCFFWAAAMPDFGARFESHSLQAMKSEKALYFYFKANVTDAGEAM